MPRGITCRPRLSLSLATRQIHQVQLSYSDGWAVVFGPRLDVRARLDRDGENGVGPGRVLGRGKRVNLTFFSTSVVVFLICVIGSIERRVAGLRSGVRQLVYRSGLKGISYQCRTDAGCI